MCFFWPRLWRALTIAAEKTGLLCLALVKHGGILSDNPFLWDRCVFPSPSNLCVCVLTIILMCFHGWLPWLLACASVACCLHVVCVGALGELFLCLNGWSQLCGMFVTRKQQNQPHGLMKSHEYHPARPHRRRSERILNTCVFRLWITCLKPKLKGCVPICSHVSLSQLVWYPALRDPLICCHVETALSPLLDLSWPTSTNVPMRKIDWLWSASGCLAKCISVRDVDGHQSFVPRMPYGNIWEWHWHHCSLYYCTCCNDSSHLITSWKVVDREYTWI